jgi:hypothetical protein
MKRNLVLHQSYTLSFPISDRGNAIQLNWVELKGYRAELRQMVIMSSPSLVKTLLPAILSVLHIIIIIIITIIMYHFSLHNDNHCKCTYLTFLLVMKLPIFYEIIISLTDIIKSINYIFNMV